MAELPSYFNTFLREIRPTKSQWEDMRSGYKTLRRRLRSFDGLKEIYVSDFLQGSYRRSTAIRPAEEQCSDVDLVVVTNLDSRSVTPAGALERLVPFLEEYYEGKWEPQGRSIGIKLSYVELDLVVTAAPSEVAQVALRWEAVRTLDAVEETHDWRLNEYWVALENREELSAASRLFKAMSAAEWKGEPLLIPDRDAAAWQETHPLAQISWTFKKNAATNGHYVNVVKAIKWWWRTQHPGLKHPKGYPLEHILGDTCPDGVGSVAEGVTHTLEAVRDDADFRSAVDEGRVPELTDRGTDQNVLKRLTSTEFKKFHQQATSAAALAREAFAESDPRESAGKWGELLGSKFPKPPEGRVGKDEGGSGTPPIGGFSERRDESEVPRGRFA